MKAGITITKVALRLFTAAAVLAFALTGCGGGGGGGGGATGSTGGTTIPATPSNVAAVSGNGKVTLSWLPVSGATSYNLYWSTTSGVTKANGTKIASVNSSYTQTGLTNGTTYFYVLTAFNSAGESVASSQVSATPAITTTAPSSPTIFSIVPASTQLTINWFAVTGYNAATSYNLYWSTTSGVTPANGTKIANITSASTVSIAYTQTGLTNGTPYYYVVTAVNSSGESATSAQVTATPVATPAGWSGSTTLYSNGSQLTPTSSSINDNGIGIAVWDDWTSGFPTTAHASIYQNGVFSSAPITIGTLGSNSGSVSVNASGDGFLVYVQTIWNATLTVPVSSSIYATVYHHATNIWTAPVQISSAPANAYSYTPKVVADSLGNAMAVWQDASNQVYASRYSGTAGTWGTGGAISASPGGVAEPKVVVDSNNVFTAVWGQDSVPIGTTGNHPEPYAARYTTAWSNPALIGWPTTALTGANDAGGGISVSANATGTVFVAWAQTITPSGGTTQYCVDTVQYNPSTATWSAAPTHITSSTVNWTSWPTVAVDGTGNALAVWDETLPATGINVVQASRYTAGTWSTPAEIDLNNGDSVGVITFAMDASGNADVMWEDITFSTSVNYGTNLRHYDATGGTGWGAITAKYMQWAPLYSKSPKGYGILTTTATPYVYGYVLTP